MTRFTYLQALAFVALAAVIAACGGDSAAPATGPTATAPAATGAARAFFMGVSSQPARTDEQAYRDAFEIAGEAGDVVLIQRTPPWTEFMPGGSISSRTEQLTLLEKELAEDHDLKLFLAIDPTQPGDRAQVANLPPELAGEGFANPQVRAAFVAYAKYLALNYKPAYMALGVEVDVIYAARGSESFDNFQTLYAETYDAVKSVSAATQVFPTFQYENMLGLLNTGSQTLPSWQLLERFEPRIDMLAVTSYPGLVFESVAELPLDYYRALSGVSDKPVMFASVGWHSRPGTADSPDSAQVSYLYRVLAAVEELRAGGLIWYLGRDPEAIPPGFELLAQMGLHDAAGLPKRVWRVWQSTAARPSTLP